MTNSVPAQEPFRISQRLSYSGQLCTIRYIGSVQGTTGTWLGVEWDNPKTGKHAGTHNNVKYFNCVSLLPTAASFVRPTRPHDPPRSFLQALRGKYVAEESSVVQSNKNQVFFNGKLAEEIGFEKVAAQQAALDELRIVVLDGLRVAGLKDIDNYQLGPGSEWDRLVEEITSTCASITDLDLSRNLIEDWVDVVGICQGLPKLKKLVLDGNRFQADSTRSPSGLASKYTVLANIEELYLRAVLQTWDQISGMLGYFSSLKRLSLVANNLSSPFTTPHTLNLTSLDLSLNPLKSFDAIIPFAALPHLSILSLGECSIASLTPIPCCFSVLQELDISSNNISSFTDLSVLPRIFPKLLSFRCSSNPFYVSVPADEAHMLSLARLPSIVSLNYSQISDKERENAELYYLSRIRNDLTQQTQASAIPIQETLTQSHPLWKTLASKHNQTEDFNELLSAAESAASAASNNSNGTNPILNPNSLGARLIELQCKINPPIPAPARAPAPTQAQSESPHSPQSPAPLSSVPTQTQSEIQTLTLTLPKSTSPYRLKSRIGNAIHVFPHLLRLIWETGELDPVGRNIGNPGRVGEGRRIAEAQSDDEESDDDDNDDGGEGRERQDAEENKHKWIQREIEIEDSTRPLGYWTEGRKAVIRVEIIHGNVGHGV